MDPEENLKQQRELAQAILNSDEADVDPGDVLLLAELVLALDEWLTKGGEKPRAWKRVNPT